MPQPLAPTQSRTRCHPWQLSDWAGIEKVQRAARLPHALLIEGDPGTGRNDFALALARQLLCQEPGDGGNCGHCKACRLSASGAHADFLRVAPEAEGKAIGVDAIRGALRFATGTSTLGPRKVMLLSPAESLTNSAFNAFLKCLEEPTPNSYILLVSSLGHKLPATIRSRCQRLLLAGPSEQEASRWLDEQLDVAGAELASGDRVALLALSGQRPLQALRLVSSGDAPKLLALNALLRPGIAAGLHGFAGAEGVPIETLLAMLERNLHDWLAQQSAQQLRRSAGREAFAVLDLIDRLRAAQRAGSNPNPELLRFQLLHAWRSLWERAGDDDRLLTLTSTASHP
ncbi:MAG: DNA polymerase-3 subunit delta' [Halieaceae bacterium]|jgi:DNA polymerase-3 subunit delta'